jgi:hypothetical protein
VLLQPRSQALENLAELVPEIERILPDLMPAQVVVVEPPL